jgi:hypothetical protein
VSTAVRPSAWLGMPAITVVGSTDCSGRVAEWQTRWLQVPVSFGTWGFKSPFAHKIELNQAIPQVVAEVYLAREVSWTGWLLYTHESTPVGAGISYVRDPVHTDEGELIASFARL